MLHFSWNEVKFEDFFDTNYWFYFLLWIAEGYLSPGEICTLICHNRKVDGKKVQTNADWDRLVNNMREINILYTWEKSFRSTSEKNYLFCVYVYPSINFQHHLSRKGAAG